MNAERNVILYMKNIVNNDNIQHSYNICGEEKNNSGILDNNVVKKRDSNIELLRIIAILLIIMYHYSVHGGYENFSYSTLTGGQIFIQIMGLFGRASCSIFALISGYYLITKKDKNHYKKIFPLIADLYFYSIILFAIVYFFKLTPVSIKDAIKAFFPIIFGPWYVVFYILFYLFIPFINKWLLSLNKNEYKILLIFIFLIWSFIPTFFLRTWQFSNIDFFIVMYMLGAYIRLYLNRNHRLFFWISIISGILMILSVLSFDMLGYLLKNNIFILKATYFRYYNSILAVIWAASTFIYFIDVKFKSKLINFISPSVLGIYLIHENDLLKKYIWTGIFPNVNYMNFPYFHALIKILCIFIACLIIDLIKRFTISKIFKNWLDKNYNKICLFFKNKISILFNK